jgi:hypothetical protein
MKGARAEEAKNHLQTFILPLYQKQFPGCDISIVDLPTLDETNELVLPIQLQYQLYATMNGTLTSTYTHVQVDPRRITRYIFINWS